MASPQLAAVLVAASAMIINGAVPATVAPTGHSVVDVNGSDYNGDGFEDLAVGAPSKYVDFISRVGTVSVLYGSSDGLSAKGDQMWWPGSHGLVGDPSEDSFFGIALASADFDADGYDDLAAGAYAEDVDGGWGGTVRVLYGSPTGLGAPRNQLWSGASSGIDGDPTMDGFGGFLDSGDLNGDGLADLAIGVDGSSSKRAVHVLYGSVDGLASTDTATFERASSYCGGQDGDVSVGDFDGDAYDDLAWGQPCHDAGRGRAEVWFGSADGVTDGDSVVIEQGLGSGIGESAPDERFATTVTALDTDGDGADELVVGTDDDGRGEGWRRERATISVFPWSADRTLDRGAARRTVKSYADNRRVQRLTWIELAAGDVTGDRIDDLIVGVPSALVEANRDDLDRAGIVLVVPGGPDGLARSAIFVREGYQGVGDLPEIDENFGISAVVRDFDGDRTPELAVGALENIGEPYSHASRAGGVFVATGPVRADEPTSWEMWSLASPGVIGDPGSYEGWSYLDG